jgi:hypothetical protein
VGSRQVGEADSQRCRACARFDIASECALYLQESVCYNAGVQQELRWHLLVGQCRFNARQQARSRCEPGGSYWALPFFARRGRIGCIARLAGPCADQSVYAVSGSPSRRRCPGREGCEATQPVMVGMSWPASGRGLAQGLARSPTDTLGGGCASRAHRRADSQGAQKRLPETRPHVTEGRLKSHGNQKSQAS